jgi:hypothetical protein
MTVKTLETNYRVEEFTITADNVDLFKLMENRRLVSDSHVSRIHGRLMNGDNPIDTITVNKVPEGYRVIDGNHRIDAIRRFYMHRKENCDVKIKCTLKVYDNISLKDELIVYDNIAKQKPQTFDDMLQLHSNELELWKLIKTRGFPCKVYISGVGEGIKLKTLIEALHNNDGDAFTPRNVRKHDIVDTANGFNFQDYMNLVDFTAFFIDCYGQVTRENIYSKPQIFEPLFDIFMRNKHMREHPNFKERFTKIIGHPLIVQYTGISGREAKIRLRQIMIEAMNYRISKNPFL